MAGTAIDAVPRVLVLFTFQYDVVGKHPRRRRHGLTRART